MINAKIDDDSLLLNLLLIPVLLRQYLQCSVAFKFDHVRSLKTKIIALAFCNNLWGGSEFEALLSLSSQYNKTTTKFLYNLKNKQQTYIMPKPTFFTTANRSSLSENFQISSAAPQRPASRAMSPQILKSILDEALALIDDGDF